MRDKIMLILMIFISTMCVLIFIQHYSVHDHITAAEDDIINIILSGEN